MIIIDLVTLALAKKYTEKTVSGIGAIKGEDGKSAYKIAVENGFIGTEAEWLESLKGKDGIGITASEINESGELVLTYSDGSTANVGVVKGKDGIDNTAAIAQNTADIDELKVKTLPSVNLTLPPVITAIPDLAFCANQSIISAVIHDKATSIGMCAFSFCKNLTDVTIGNSVTKIGGSAFYNCSNLASATIGNSVTSIDGAAFSMCTSLASIAIPDSVTNLDRSAFWGCKNLANVTIGNSVTKIGGSAFQNCTSLTSITIPNSVTKIDVAVFYNCTNLTSITIPNSVQSFGRNAFKNCTSLENITLGNNFNADGLNLSESDKIERETAINMFNALYDRTGSFARTLTLNKTVGDKLTDEDKAIATNKNWTIVFN